MLIKEYDLRKMIEFTLLHNVDSIEDIKAFAKRTLEGNYAAAFTMPVYCEFMVHELASNRSIHTGAPIAFPTGAEPAAIKVAMVKYHVANGVDDMDFVQNLCLLKSGKYDEMLEEEKQIVAAAQGHTVKCIIEATCLTDEEIATSCKIAVKAGCDYVKTGTGTMPNPTTVHHIEVIRRAVGDAIKIKAAGGIRDCETLLAMARLGVTRFGISWNSALKIIDEFNRKYPNGVEL